MTKHNRGVIETKYSVIYNVSQNDEINNAVIELLHRVVQYDLTEMMTMIIMIEMIQTTIDELYSYVLKCCNI